jgi:hypothetical protein
VQAEKRSFRQGWNWLAEGFALYRMSPPALAMLTITFLLAMLVINSVPVVGPVAGSLLMPFFSVGMMNACRRIENGETPRFDALFSAFRQSPQTLLSLGALYLGLTLLTLGITTLIDGGTLMSFMTGGQIDHAELDRDEALLAAQVALLLMMPLVAAFWYAPLLAAWHQTSLAKSLFFSLVAVMRNWAAFLGYGLACFVFGMFFPSVIISVAALVIESQAVLLALVGAPLLLVLGPTLFATFFVSYRDVFVSPSPAPSPEPAPHVDNQA